MGATGEGGEYTLKVRGWLKDIMYGGEPQHKWAVIIPEEGEEA
jgi:branched-chain amino acid aminotransferase